MTNILLISVGGSPQPIITAIRSLNPDRVVFFCSDGPHGSKSQVIGTGKPCEIRQAGKVVEALPNLPTYLELGDRFNAARDIELIENPDDLSECYSKAAARIRSLRRDQPNAQLQADYTGATKTIQSRTL